MLCGGRIDNPNAIDQELIAATLASGRDRVVVQFSRRAAYDSALLQELNAACERFGARLQVRFYSHGWKPFDCGVLRELPAVRSLSMDTLLNVFDLDALEEMRFLEEFAFGAFEAKLPRLLEMKSLHALRSLTLVAARKDVIDLSPLREFANLEELFLNKHSKNIDVLMGNSRVRLLALSQIGRAVEVGFVRSMSGLRVLKIILGGRTGIEEMANGAVEEMEVMRVQGIERVELGGYPGLRSFTMEDQLRVEEIDLSPATELEKLHIINCKGLKRLKGMKSLKKLRYVWIGMAKLDPDELMASFPAGLETVSLFGFGARRDPEIRKRLDEAGYIPVGGRRVQNEAIAVAGRE